MDTGEIGIIVAIVIGVGALLWQSWIQGNRLDRKIESESDRLDRRIESIEGKVSDAALTAARNEGRYDVLTAQTHTHESSTITAD